MRLAAGRHPCVIFFKQLVIGSSTSDAWQSRNTCCFCLESRGTHLKFTMAGRQAVKAYLDLMSQPCRAVLIFLKNNKIPHTVEHIALRKGEQHYCEEFVQWRLCSAFVKSRWLESKPAQRLTFRLHFVYI